MENEIRLTSTGEDMTIAEERNNLFSLVKSALDIPQRDYVTFCEWKKRATEVLIAIAGGASRGFERIEFACDSCGTQLVFRDGAGLVCPNFPSCGNAPRPTEERVNGG